MKSQKIMAAAIFLFLCIAIGGLYCCKTITNRTAPAPSIQYDEELSQICNHYNSGLIQQNEGIFYELESAETGFVLCRGRSMDAIDEPMNISVASSGFWVKGGRVYYIGGDSGNELRAVNLDGTDDTLLFSASVQDFLITGDELSGSISKRGT